MNAYVITYSEHIDFETHFTVVVGVAGTRKAANKAVKELDAKWKANPAKVLKWWSKKIHPYQAPYEYRIDNFDITPFKLLT